MNKLNNAALENVNGGTFDENVDLTKAFRMECGVNDAALIQMLYFNCSVVGHVYDQRDKPNQYYDYETYTPLTHAEVMARIG